jgi:TolA-binding protein
MTEKSLQQSASAPSANQPRGRTFTPYVLIWAGLATLSLVYLGLLATQPALVAGLLGATPQQQTAATTEGDAARERAIGEAVAEVRTLRDTIDQFRNELIEIRAQVSNQGDATREIASRVSTLETDPAELQRLAKDAAAKSAAQAKLAKAEAAQKLAAEKAAAAAEAKKKQSPGIETGSVAQPATAGPAITFGPATVTPTPAALPPAGSKQIGVQIATGPSVDSLRLSWSLLNERHGNALRAYEPRYTTDVSGAEQTYDLVVGPIATVDDARRLCQELALKATPCTVSRFTGDAL